nr:precorrin-6y C5,15-methyltransferase (decarboxylating) subunit CbiE [Nocardia bovistercoris]
MGRAGRDAIADGAVVFGSARQLELIPEGVGGVRRRWPSPLVPALPALFGEVAGRRVTVVASGDPMFYGIGVTLVGLFGAQALRVLPQPSSASLACARLGWSSAETPVVSAVGRPLTAILPELSDRRRLLVLTPDAKGPAAVAELLRDNGFGGSAITVLEQLGGPAERVVSGVAASWDRPPGDPLTIVAVECAAEPGRPRLTRVPGLPDAAYSGDGQLTKAEVRALTLSALAPAPGEALWDVGGGSGTIAIEWCRTHPACRAVSFERVESRRRQITDNAAALGAARVLVRGAVPQDLDGVPDEFGAPDAIFVGGGLTADGLLETLWSHLRHGGRLVANAVTAESESLLVAAARARGGELRRFQIYRGEELGNFTAWRPHLPVAQWTVTKTGP